MTIRARLRRCTNMAAEDARGALIIFSVLLLFFGYPSFAANERFPNTEHVKKWAEAINTDLVLKLNLLTGYDVFNLSYNKPEYLNMVEFHEVNETSLVESMAAQLSKMLSKKMEALWRLVHAAEDAAKNHTYNPYLQKTDSSYPNAKELNDDDLEYDIHFQQKVNFSFSSVHIPVEIYDGEISILNGLNWTATLDEQFNKNYLEDRQILWQFFGSQTGFMRTYPASKWNKRGTVDLFDVRRQSWYTQGSSSPKDMIILIDKSGSTHGQALQLMKNAVKSILDTLGENDFVNIVAFSQEADFVSKCFNHTAFVQANYRNKKQLEKDVDKMVAGGQAEYKAGLRFAFEKFEEFANNSRESSNNVGANCNKVIILLTDGGTDNAEEVFKEYNWPNKSVRVFTYAIGPTATPVAAIKWMACANRGYFSQIPAMGAIRARVQEHTRFLKQGMEQLNVQPHQWEITVDPRLGMGERGLGMMTTVTLPVYNRTLESQNQTILGVMGIDVPTTELGKHTPFTQIGPNGYSFAINPNGYAVFHPNLRRSGRYLKDPPNIDILELELEEERDQFVKLRDSMIEGEKGSILIPDTIFLSPDKKYVSWASANYAYTNITNTTFRLGLCVPEFQRHYPYFKNTSVPDFGIYKTRKDGPVKGDFLIAPWEYLGSDPYKTKDLNNSLDNLLELLKDPTKTSALSEDDKQRLQTLAKDVAIAVHMEIFFTSLRANNSEEVKQQNMSAQFNLDITPLLDWLTDLLPEPDVSFHFMASNGGLTMVFPASKSHEFNDLLDIRNASYYQRAIYAGADYIFTPVMDTQNDSVSELLIVRSAGTFRYDHRAAVLGALINADKVREVMLDMVRNTTPKFGGTGTLYTCDNDTNMHCYLVDDGGFLVASNQDMDKVGTFLGVLDPQVFHAVQNESIFSSSVQYDFQATCTMRKEKASAGAKSFLVPRLSMLFDALSVNWWTSKVTWALTSLNVYNWLFGYESVFGQVLSDGIDSIAYDDEVLGLNEEEECVMGTQQFYINNLNTQLTKGVPIELSVDCINNTRKVIVSRLVRDVRLLFIVAEPPIADCGSDDVEVSQESFRVDEKLEENLICNLSMHPRKRVVSYGCYDNDPNEDDSKCDASALRHSKLTAVIASLITTVVVCQLSQHPR